MASSEHLNGAYSMLRSHVPGFVNRSMIDPDYATACRPMQLSDPMPDTYTCTCKYIYDSQCDALLAAPI